MKIYYSRMNQTPSDIFLAESSILVKELGISNITFHGGGQYDEKKLLQSVAVIVTFYNGNLVGRGVFSEINNAIINNIPVYQFYRPNNGSFDGITIFRRVTSCNIFDRTDYYLQYGKCNYQPAHGNTSFPLILSLDSMVERIKSTDQDIPQKKKPGPPYIVEEEDEEVEEIEEEKKKEIDSGDFDEDTNMLY